MVISAEQTIRQAFAARIGCADRPSAADYAGAGIAQDHFAPQQTGPDEIVLARFIEDGAFTVCRHPVAGVVAMFGALFASGKPTVAQFTAACDATPDPKPPEWPGCRGFCRYADKFKAEGILA
jgi:hypothetical protein